jgi:diguanylate cyclase (GGDEF)-like protein
LPLKERHAPTDHHCVLIVGRAFATVAVVSVLALVPGAAATASVETPDLVRGLANEAADLVAQERELLDLIRPGTSLSAEALAEARASLAAVDADAVQIMQQLDLLGVDLSNAVRATMSLLPAPGDASGETTPPVPPPRVVYDAAIDDLMRIAATPAASTPITKSSDGGGSLGLLAVAAGALLALGVAALANTLRRTNDDQDLAAMAWSDGLTGVANRRRLDRDLAAHAKGAGPTAVIMVDVDHFKQVNDRYGHQIGDEVLRSIGNLLSDYVRHDDVVYRYGGEEFCILLPEATQDDARAIADRIVTAVRSIQLPDGTHVTVSIGIADGAAADVAGTLETADRALYAAKSGGRDRTSAAGTDTLESV